AAAEGGEIHDRVAGVLQQRRVLAQVVPEGHRGTEGRPAGRAEGAEPELDGIAAQKVGAQNPSWRRARIPDGEQRDLKDVPAPEGGAERRRREARPVEVKAARLGLRVLARPAGQDGEGAAGV